MSTTPPGATGFEFKLADGSVVKAENIEEAFKTVAKMKEDTAAALKSERAEREQLEAELAELEGPRRKAAVDAIADFAIEYTNAISAIATSEYVAHTRALAAAEVDRRAELLNILLNGYDESDERVGRLLKRAGFLEQRQSYCVAVVQAVNAAEMEHRARAQRLWEAVVDAMAKTSIRVLAGVRNNLVVAVLMDARRQSGWTAPCTGLAKRIRPQLQKLGPSVLVGISLDHFTGDQWQEGEHISRSQLQPGDLVFFFADISHVGMYVGDGMMIDAPNFGEDVKVEPVYWSAFVGAVRIA